MVSVCVATYNGEKYISEQISSILSQLGAEDEIIVSDDSSTDNTVGIVQSFNDDRIKILGGQTFHSPVYNFEHAIKCAKGDYIFLCDQDDVWTPGKVPAMLERLAEYDMVMSNAVVVDGDLVVIEERLYPKPNVIRGLFRNWLKNPYSGCLMAFRRSCTEFLLPFPKKLPMHDMWIGYCCQLFASVSFLNEPLVLYRRHGHNTSSASEKSTQPFSTRIKNRFRILNCLIGRWCAVKKGMHQQDMNKLVMI